MQIRKIVLFGHNGEEREIVFHLNRLNVVTGNSKTGKSALLDIAEYCLGRKSFLVPVGPISDKVAWYGILLQTGATRIWIARPAPAQGKASSSQAMLEIGVDIDAAASSELKINADTSTVRETLNQALGIEPFTVDGGFGSFGNDYAVSATHAATLCFQQQNEIASQDYLFHGQSDLNWAQAIKNTLPYFLGIVSVGHGALKQQLANLQREERRDYAALSSLEREDGEVEGELLALHRDAVAIGLVQPSEVMSREVILATLKSASDEFGASREPETSHYSERRNIRTERAELLRELRDLDDQLFGLAQLNQSEREFQSVVQEQIRRLSAAGIVLDEASTESHCPLCEQRMDAHDPSVSELLERQRSLATQLSPVDDLRASRSAAVREVEMVIAQKTKELSVLNLAEAGVASAHNADLTSRSTAEAIQFRRGRISAFLERYESRDSGRIGRVRTRMEVRAAKMTEIEATIDPELIAERQASKSNLISAYMGEWARELELEHSEGALRLDLKNLTVIADTPSGPAVLRRIGSGQNWVGYHVVAHAALHRIFIEEDRPVPRFLFLDQPTQAHYPSDKQNSDSQQDSDRRAVRNLYRFLDTFTKKYRDFQIIVCDHANLDEDWFQKAVVEDWREGEKLVPEGWSLPEA